MEHKAATNTPEFSDFSIVKQNTSYILNKKGGGRYENEKSTAVYQAQIAVDFLSQEQNSPFINKYEISAAVILPWFELVDRWLVAYESSITPQDNSRQNTAAQERKKTPKISWEKYDDPTFKDIVIRNDMHILWRCLRWEGEAQKVS